MSTNDHSEMLDFTKEMFPHTYFIFETYPHEVMKVHLNILSNLPLNRNVDTKVDPILFDILINSITTAMIKDKLIEAAPETTSGYRALDKRFITTIKDRQTFYKNAAIKAELLAANVKGKMSCTDISSDPIPLGLFEEAYSLIDQGILKILNYKPTTTTKKSNEKFVTVDIACLLRAVEIEESK